MFGSLKAMAGIVGAGIKFAFLSAFSFFKSPAFRTAIKAFGKAIFNFAKAVFLFLKTSGVVSKIVTFLGKVLAKIPGLATSLFAKLSGLLSTLAGSTFFKTFLAPLLTSVLTSVLSGMLLGALGGIFSRIFGGRRNGGNNGLGGGNGGGGSSSARKLLSTVTGILVNPFRLLKPSTHIALFTGMVGTITGVFTGGWKKVWNMFGKGRDDALGETSRSVDKTMGKVFGSMEDRIKAFLLALSAATGQFSNDVKEATSNIGQATGLTDQFSDTKISSLRESQNSITGMMGGMNSKQRDDMLEFMRQTAKDINTRFSPTYTVDEGLDSFKDIMQATGIRPNTKEDATVLAQLVTSREMAQNNFGDSIGGGITDFAYQLKKDDVLNVDQLRGVVDSFQVISTNFGLSASQLDEVVDSTKDLAKDLNRYTNGDTRLNESALKGIEVSGAYLQRVGLDPKLLNKAFGALSDRGGSDANLLNKIGVHMDDFQAAITSGDSKRITDFTQDFASKLAAAAGGRDSSGKFVQKLNDSSLNDFLSESGVETKDLYNLTANNKLDAARFINKAPTLDYLRSGDFRSDSVSKYTSNTQVSSPIDSFLAKVGLNEKVVALRSTMGDVDIQKTAGTISLVLLSLSPILKAFAGLGKLALVTAFNPLVVIPGLLLAVPALASAINTIRSAKDLKVPAPGEKKEDEDESFSKTAADKVSESFKAILGKILGPLGETLADFMSPFVKKVTEKVLVPLIDFFEKSGASKAIDSFTNILVGFVGTFVHLLTKVDFDTAIGMMGRAFQILGDLVSRTLIWISGIDWKKLFSPLEPLIADIEQMLGPLSQKSLGEVFAPLINFFTWIGNSGIVDILSGMASVSLSTGFGVFKFVIDQLVMNVLPTLWQIGQGIWDTIGDVVGYFQTLLGGEGVGSGGLQGFFSDIKVLFSDVLTFFGNFLTVMTPVVQYLWDNFFQPMVKTTFMGFGALIGVVAWFGSKLWGGLNLLNKGIGIGISWFGFWIGTMLDYWNGLMDGLSTVDEFFHNFSNTLIGGFNSMFADILESLRNFSILGYHPFASLISKEDVKERRDISEKSKIPYKSELRDYITSQSTNDAFKASYKNYTSGGEIPTLTGGIADLTKGLAEVVNQNSQDDAAAGDTSTLSGKRGAIMQAFGMRPGQQSLFSQGGADPFGMGVPAGALPAFPGSNLAPVNAFQGPAPFYKSLGVNNFFKDLDARLSGVKTSVSSGQLDPKSALPAVSSLATSIQQTGDAIKQKFGAGSKEYLEFLAKSKPYVEQIGQIKNAVVKNTGKALTSITGNYGKVLGGTTYTSLVGGAKNAFGWISDHMPGMGSGVPGVPATPGTEGTASGGIPRYLSRMMQFDSQDVGKQCGAAITEFLGQTGFGKYGTATGLDTAKNQVAPNADGTYKPGTIFHWNIDGKSSIYKHGHYAIVGPDGKHWVESNMQRGASKGAHNWVSTDREIDWNRDIKRATYGGRVHAYAPPGAFDSLSTPITSPNSNYTQGRGGGLIDYSRLETPRSKASGYEKLVYSGAAGAGISPHLLASLLDTESHFDASANAGDSRMAQGIAQFMPATAKAAGVKPLIPEQAIPAAAKHLAKEIAYFSDPRFQRTGLTPEELGAAAYNSGRKNVLRHFGFEGTYYKLKAGLQYVEKFRKRGAFATLPGTRIAPDSTTPTPTKTQTFVPTNYSIGKGPNPPSAVRVPPGPSKPGTTSGFRMDKNLYKRFFGGVLPEDSMAKVFKDSNPFSGTPVPSVSPVPVAESPSAAAALNTGLLVAAHSASYSPTPIPNPHSLAPVPISPVTPPLARDQVTKVTVNQDEVVDAVNKMGNNLAGILMNILKASGVPMKDFPDLEDPAGHMLMGGGGY